MNEKVRQKPNILLVMPSFNPYRNVPDITSNTVDYACVPVSLIALSAFLEREGYCVKILDTRLHTADESRKIFQKALHGNSIVGFSVMTSCIRESLDLSDMVKQTDKEIITVWGGVHPTLFPHQTARDRSVDYVVVGEGEIPFLRLIKKIESGEKDFHEIPNVCFKENGDTRIKRMFQFVDINSLPFPGYNLLDIEKYLYKAQFDGKIRRGLDINTTRGCPHRCAFCINTIVNNRSWRAQSPKISINNLSRLLEEYSLEYLFIMDEDFFPNINRAIEIIKYLKTARVKWDTSCRVDYFNKNMINDDVLRLLRDSGCIMLRFGIESGSEKVRKMLKKDISEENIVTAIRKCAEFGIQPMISYMIGMPGETKEDMIQTMKMVSRLQRISPNVIHVGPQIFRPYPSSEMYNQCLASGYDEPSTLRDWYNSNPVDYNTTDEYPWILNHDFVLDVITVMRHVESENKRVYRTVNTASENKYSAEEFLKNIVRFIFNKRYVSGFWGLPVDIRMVRKYMRYKVV